MSDGPARADDERPGVTSVTVAGCRLTAVHENGVWTAWAERHESGNRFGIQVTAPTSGEALAQLRRWLEWQREHTDALGALQEAQRAYHRAVAERAFGGQGGPAATRDSLELVERACARLDDVRARRP